MVLIWNLQLLGLWKIDRVHTKCMSTLDPRLSAHNQVTNRPAGQNRWEYRIYGLGQSLPPRRPPLTRSRRNMAAAPVSTDQAASPRTPARAWQTLSTANMGT